jgi:hypothetical protein
MKRDDSGSFFLAISSINITHYLMVYFYLNKDDVSSSHKRLRAGRKQFKRFVKLNAMSKKTFYEINAFALRYLYYLWKKEVKKCKQERSTFPNFNLVLDETRLSLHGFLRHRITDLDDLKSKCDSVIEQLYN